MTQTGYYEEEILWRVKKRVRKGEMREKRKTYIHKKALQSGRLLLIFHILTTATINKNNFNKTIWGCVHSVACICIFVVNVCLYGIDCAMHCFISCEMVESSVFGSGHFIEFVHLNIVWGCLAVSYWTTTGEKKAGSDQNKTRNMHTFGCDSEYGNGTDTGTP